MTDTTELVHLEVADGVATVTLDSPHNRNALSRQLVTELDERIAAADADEEVRVILLRSSGRVFCAGADLAEAAAAGAGGAGGAGGWDAAGALVGLLRRIVAADTPVVVELAGPVVAGGLGIVGAADVVIASTDVSVQLTEVRLGLTPAIISLTLLPRLTPRAASDLFLTGRKIGADEAAAVGLVTRAVAPEALGEVVASVVADLAAGSPQGLREGKRLVNAPLVDYIDAHGDDMASLSKRLFSSPEAQAAFLKFFAGRR